MAKLRADKKNYKKAFTIHANAYDNWNLGSDNSRRLILCYCVECGLKCLIMDNDNICTISQANEKTEEVLCTHDFRKLLKEVGQSGQFQFKQFVTEYGNTVCPSEYHQLCRYNIAPKDIEDIIKFENVLNEIKNWLKEVV